MKTIINNQKTSNSRTEPWGVPLIIFWGVISKVAVTVYVDVEGNVTIQGLSFPLL